MLSIAEEATEIQALRLRVGQLEAEVSASHEREWQAIEGERLAIEREERSSARAEQYRQELQYQNAVIAIPSTSLGASQKLTMIAARRFVRELRVDPYVETVIHLPNIGKTIGMSPDTVRDNLKYFTKHLPDVLEYRFDREKLKDDFGRVVIGADKKPVFRTTSYITLKPLIEFPQEIIADAPRKQGGLRKCICGSENVRSFPIHVCMDCGNVEFSDGAREALSSVNNMHMDEALEQSVELSIDEKQDAFELETSTNVPIVSTVSQEATVSVTGVETPIVHVEIEVVKNASESIAEPIEHIDIENSTAIETLVAMLAHYNVKHLDYMICHCGCKLFYTSLGDWTCARCEPGNFWPDNYIKAIKAVYPGKVAKVSRSPEVRL